MIKKLLTIRKEVDDEPLYDVVQGDIRLVRIPSKDEPSVAKSRRELRPERAILGFGEVTGHVHVIDGNASWLVEAAEDVPEDHINELLKQFAIDGKQTDVLANAFFLKVEGDAVLRHLDANGEATGEHGDAPLIPGTYAVIRQREYDDTKEVRFIAD